MIYIQTITKKTTHILLKYSFSKELLMHYTFFFIIVVPTVVLNIFKHRY